MWTVRGERVSREKEGFIEELQWEGKKGYGRNKYDQHTTYAFFKCHREINSLLQLMYADEYKYANIFGSFLQTHL